MSHSLSEVSGVRPLPVDADDPSQPSLTGTPAESPSEPPEDTRRIPLSVPGWLLSSLVHLSLILLMGLLSFPAIIGTGGTLVIGDISTIDTTGNSLEELAAVSLPQADLSRVEMEPEDPEPLASVSDITSESPPPLESLNPLTHEMSPLSDVGMPTSQFVEDPGNGMNVSGLSGREGAARASLLESGGGTPGTEEAVQRALLWLANHQHENGSWDFDTACDCPNAGHLTGETVSATALALLPFLGAGNTHEEGEYREVVKKGLYFLRQQQDSQGSFLEPEGGKMYAHALASIALCEAYAMSQDRGLRSAAQQSLDFISTARDPRGGGWRYTIGEPGDTSVTGWVIMALKSGRMGYLSIPNETVQGAKTFLDSMQTEGGSTYGYDRPGDAPGTSAVGLLCRMYMGWSRDHQGLRRGVELLAKHGPSKDDIYYDYYATQVMRHYGGSSWEKWNQRMRGILVNSQQKTGHTAGSWFFPHDKGAVAGGRLYSTAMATMILEVYYRHLPIYGENAASDHFPL